MFRSVLSALALALLAPLVLGACEPTPAYLQRWANTPESEDRFEEYLLDETLSHEVHVKALELLLEQWQYSSSKLVNGGIVRDMRPIAERDATRDAAPASRRSTKRAARPRPMRDAAYHMPRHRRRRDQGHLPRRRPELGQRMGPRRVVRRVGADRGPDPGRRRRGGRRKLVEHLRESPFDRVICSAARSETACPG